MDAETLIRGALRLCGVRLPISTQLSEGLSALNQMLNIWNAENLMVYDIIKEYFTLTSGTGTYSIGSGGDLDTDRPQKLIDAFIRDDNAQDYPVKVDMTEKEYNAIIDKTASQRPEKLYYKSSYSLGYIYFDYVPDDDYEFHLDSWKQISELAALDTTISLPNEYETPLRYNLAVLLADEYGITVSKNVISIAVSTKTILENFNVPLLQPATLDSLLTRSLCR